MSKEPKASAVGYTDWDRWRAALDQWRMGVDRTIAELTARVAELETNSKLDEIMRLLTLVKDGIDKRLVSPEDLSRLDRIKGRLDLLDPVKPILRRDHG